MKNAATICINSGDCRARVLEQRDALIEAHLKLVPPIARRVQRRLPPSFDLDDLIGEGNIGLMHAASRYRPAEHGDTPFPAYAKPRIHGAIVDSIRRRAWLENTANPLEDAPEPATTRALPFAIVGSQSARAKRPVKQFAVFDKTRMPRGVAEAFERLTARERNILRAVYGDEFSLPEIGRLLNLTPAKVEAEHRAALNSLHAILVKRMSLIGSTLVYFRPIILQERAA